MQQPYLPRGPQCLAAGDKRPASVSVNKGIRVAVVVFDKACAYSSIDTGAKIQPLRRSLGDKFSSRVKRSITIEPVSFIDDTRDK